MYVDQPSLVISRNGALVTEPKVRSLAVVPYLVRHLHAYSRRRGGKNIPND